MESNLITISEAATRLGVSIDTLRRWDESGRLSATRKSPGGNRYYSEKDIELFMLDLFKIALEWAANPNPTEVPHSFYCPDISIFQARLIRMQTELMNSHSVDHILPLIVSIAGEIGNNSFDHNIGNWPDITGIFYGYDLKKRIIVLADRGLGILRTLKRVRPKLDNHKDALWVAFTEIVSARDPEDRGNGLKFVRKVISENPIRLLFQSGDVELDITKEPSNNLNFRDSNEFLRGCIALIKY